MGQFEWLQSEKEREEEGVNQEELIVFMFCHKIRIKMFIIQKYHVGKSVHI